MSFVRQILRLFCLAVLWSSAALAQEAQTATPAPPQEEIAASPPPSAESPALPGEEVMHPTEHGVQFSRGLAHAFALGWINQNVGDRIDLTPEQARQFSGNLADRGIRMAQKNPQLTRNVFESLAETIMSSGGGRKMTPELAQRAAERVRPVIPDWHKFLDGAVEDGQSVLAPDQLEEVKRAVDRRHHQLDQVDGMLQRWSKGEYAETDRIDRLLDPNAQQDDDYGNSAGKTADRPQLRQARFRARWEMQRIGPSEWLQFLTAVKSSLHLDAKQIAQADQIYAQYKAKAGVIMTTSWRVAVRDNRLKSQMRWNLKNVPVEPWLFHLNQEYEALIKPIKELGGQFQRDVLSVATDQQREAFLNTLRDQVALHGLTLKDEDRAALLALLK